ncbi:MAG TPA: o-succinylbenzoate--CoA ligase [Nakamurella sp.]
MPRTLQLLPVPTGDRVLELIPGLRSAMAGTGPVLLPVPEYDETETARLATSLAAGTAMADGEDDPHDPTALVVGTSGSTGNPKGALLPASALIASAEATRDRLASHRVGGRPGHWLLCLSATHIAGLQVLLRAVAEGTAPTVLDTAPPFTAERFVAAVERMPSGSRFTSLVPTQLLRVLTDPDATTALTTFDAVLVGGASTPLALLDDAAQAGVRAVTTYGMSETCGGCVYDGVPLHRVTLSIDESADTSGTPVDPPGRVSVTGPVVARGYRDLPRHPSFRRLPGERYRTFLTGDLATRRGGRWQVVGRVDDVITTGGIKIDPAVVESVLVRVTGVREVIVTGVPDPDWGEAVVAVVVPAADGPPALDTLRRAAGYAHGPAAAPKQLILLDELPIRGPGKPDRAAIRQLAAAELAARALTGSGPPRLTW